MLAYDSSKVCRISHSTNRNWEKESHQCTADNLPTFCQIDLVCQLNATGFFFIIFLYFCHHLHVPSPSLPAILLFTFLSALQTGIRCSIVNTHTATVLSFLPVHCSLLLLVQTYKRTYKQPSALPQLTPSLQQGEALGKGRRGDMIECWAEDI